MIGQAAVIRRVTRAHPFLTDLALAIVVVGPAALPPVVAPPPERLQPATISLAVAALAFLLILGRRQAPLLALSIAVASEVTLTAITSTSRWVLIAAIVIAMYTVAATHRRRVTLIVATATTITLYLTSAWTMQSATNPMSVSLIAWTGLAVAVGGTVRTWRDYLAAVEERAARAEQTREEEARRRVAEERLRIARELHDVIAHHIALINVQAGVASHLLRAQPDQADTALGHIRQAAGTVLDELNSVLYVLRESGDDAAPTEPAPGLPRLRQLLASFTAAGLPVDYRLAGQPRPVPASIDLAAYRIIQEAMTNAHKHGDAAGAWLLLEYRPDVLRIEVGNRPAGAAFADDPRGTGHGITGMRERATSVGGSLRAGLASAGEFRLEAVLPLPLPDTGGTPAELAAGERGSP